MPNISPHTKFHPKKISKIKKISIHALRKFPSKSIPQIPKTTQTTSAGPHNPNTLFFPKVSQEYRKTPKINSAGLQNHSILGFFLKVFHKYRKPPKPYISTTRCSLFQNYPTDIENNQTTSAGSHNHYTCAWSHWIRNYKKHVFGVSFV